jgi:hypothetical protein
MTQPERTAGTSVIKADIVLRRITIELPANAMPLIKLEGHPIAASPAAARYSDVEITTRHLTPEAKAFVVSMMRDFARR